MKARIAPVVLTLAPVALVLTIAAYPLLVAFLVFSVLGPEPV